MSASDTDVIWTQTHALNPHNPDEPARPAKVNGGSGFIGNTYCDIFMFVNAAAFVILPAGTLPTGGHCEACVAALDAAREEDSE